MQKIIFRFFDICTFRAGPQDIPASVWLLRAIMVVYVTIDMLRGVAVNNVQGALAEALFELFVFAVLLYLALQWRGKRERFLQTYTAFLGTSIIIGVFYLPLVFSMESASAAGDPVGNYLVIALLFFVWAIGVLAHIVRHSFDIHLGYAIFFSIMFIIVYGQINHVLFTGAA